jgi:hypothetical protein
MNLKKKNIFPRIPIHGMLTGNEVGVLVYHEGTGPLCPPSYLFEPNPDMALGSVILIKIADAIEDANKTLESK